MSSSVIVSLSAHLPGLLFAAAYLIVGIIGYRRDKSVGWALVAVCGGLGLAWWPLGVYNQYRMMNSPHDYWKSAVAWSIAASAVGLCNGACLVAGLVVLARRERR